MPEPNSILTAIGSFLAGAAILVGWNAQALKKIHTSLENEGTERRANLKEIHERIDHLIERLIEERIEAQVAIAELNKDIDHMREAAERRNSMLKQIVAQLTQLGVKDVEIP